MNENLKEIEEISVNISLKSGFTHILFQLAAMGYTHIQVHYAGSGDSGCIEYIHLFKEGCIVEEENGDVMVDKEGSPYDKPSQDLRTRIEDYVYTNCLDSLSDWCNNEGSFGYLFINTKDGSYYCDHNVNFTETTQESSSGKFNAD